MASCGHCGRNWPADYLSCPADGSPLGRTAEDLARTVKTVLLQGSRAGGPAAPAAGAAPEPGQEQEPETAPDRAGRAAQPRRGEPFVVRPGVQIGEYVVEERVARGGMGTIYAARHPVLGRRAAIKVVHSELAHRADLLERLVREAQAVNLIRHPNIVDVFSIGTLPDGRGYFVMEWLDGGTLARHIKERGGRLSLAEAAALLDQVFDAMSAAHAAGIVHRDLKPQNIFLEDRGEAGLCVKVLDFGIAKLTGLGVEGTATGILMGTPGYLAPEQARTSQVDHRADVYALGVVAFEMLCGSRPFSGRDQESLVAKHLRAEPPRLTDRVPGLPEAIDAIVRRMLAKEPDDRPSLEEVRAVFRAAAGAAGEPTRVMEATVPGQPAPPPRRAPSDRMPAMAGDATVEDVEGAATELAIPRGAARAPSAGWHAAARGGAPARPGARWRLAAVALVAGAATAAIVAVLAARGPARQAGAAEEREATGALAPEGAGGAGDALAGDGGALAGGEDGALAGAGDALAEVDRADRTDGEALAGEGGVGTAGGEALAGGSGAAPPDAAPARARSSLVVTAPVDRAIIEVDGRVVARSSRRVSVQVRPGQHEVRVRARGRRPFRKLVRVRAGERLAVAAELPPDRAAAAGKPDRGETEEPGPPLEVKVRDLYEATGARAQRLLDRRDDEVARRLQADYLAIPSPFLTDDPEQLAAIERRLRRVDRRLRDALAE
ncbi:MAG TPA: serine/threonine-protein kinase [Kofleriaceae bacterium]|nr:serine/threonine-protein kinase [Kofleriaceae bacterium]